MSVIQIRKARRQNARVVVGFQGISGSGKTYSALQFAYGLAGYDAGKIGFLDTENRRGSLYADALKNDAGQVQEFLIGDLVPPFSPARYVEAIQEFEKAGVEVLVIDSVSHEWAGQGGCYDIAKNTSKRIDDWLTAKNEHKKFMNALLQSPMHIIVCIREAEKTDFSNPKDPKSLGLAPIQEKAFVFELTASIQMHDNGRAQTPLKCPKDLMPFLGRGNGYITSADGKAVRDWVDGGEIQDPNVARWRDRLLAVTERGEAFIADAWSKVPKDIQAALGDGFLAELTASARAFDAQAKAAAGVDDGVDALNDQLAG